MILDNVFNPKNIKVNLKSKDKRELFEEMVDLYISNSSSHDRDLILTALRSREDKLSTGIKKGIGLPHARIGGFKSPVGIIGISKQGIDYDSIDGSPVNIVFMLLSPLEDYSIHLKILNRMNTILLNSEFLDNILVQKNGEDVYKLICEYENYIETENK